MSVVQKYKCDLCLKEITERTGHVKLAHYRMDKRLTLLAYVKDTLDEIDMCGSCFVERARPMFAEAFKNVPGL